MIASSLVSPRWRSEVIASLFTLSEMLLSLGKCDDLSCSRLVSCQTVADMSISAPLLEVPLILQRIFTLAAPIDSQNRLVSSWVRFYSSFDTSIRNGYSLPWM